MEIESVRDKTEMVQTLVETRELRLEKVIRVTALISAPEVYEELWTTCVAPFGLCLTSDMAHGTWAGGDLTCVEFNFHTKVY